VLPQWDSVSRRARTLRQLTTCRSIRRPRSARSLWQAPLEPRSSITISRYTTATALVFNQIFFVNSDALVASLMAFTTLFVRNLLIPAED